jgi:hypothetical protein
VLTDLTPVAVDFECSSLFLKEKQPTLRIDGNIQPSTVIRVSSRTAEQTWDMSFDMRGLDESDGLALDANV